MSNYRFPEGGAIVFGGSGGLGTGVVELLAACGANVAFTYLTNEEAAKNNLESIEKKGVEGMIQKVDLLDLESTTSFANEAKEKFGKIHSVIFATGPFLNILPIMDANPEDVYSTLDTDIKGFYHVVKATVPLLREGGGSLTALTTAAIHKYISLSLIHI